MSPRRITFAAVAASLLLVACSDDGCDGTCADDLPAGRLYVVNAARDLGALELWVDTAMQRRRIEPGTSSGTVFLEPGTRGVRVVRPGTTATDPLELDVTLQADVPRLLVVLNAAGDLVPLVAADTGSIVPAGATKLRVVHAATGAPEVDVWRTQPDFTTPTRVMFPFAYQATSSYIQSTPGTWTVVVTPRDPAAMTPANPLASTTVQLADGQRASVVMAPGATAGSVSLVVVKEQ